MSNEISKILALRPDLTEADINDVIDMKTADMTIAQAVEEFLPPQIGVCG